MATLSAVMGAADPAAVRKAADRVYADGDYQRTLPAFEDERRERREASEELLKRRREREGRQARVAKPVSSMASVLLWGLMFAAVIILVVYLGRDFFGYAPEVAARGEGEGERTQPDTRVVDRPLGDANALAAQGNYQEAIHTLLLQTLVELSRALPEPLAPSLTSREVLAALRLRPDQHGALTGLITAVEITHFGDETPTEEDYQRCLRHFQAFASAYLRGNA